MTIGEQIRKYRTEANLSQKELGEKLGVTQQQIAQYESGKRIPKIDTINNIAGALGIGIRRLYPAFTYEEWKTSDTYKEAMKHNELIANFLKVLSAYYGTVEEIMETDNSGLYYSLSINGKKQVLTRDDIDSLLEYLRINLPFLINLLTQLP